VLEGPEKLSSLCTDSVPVPASPVGSCDTEDVALTVLSAESERSELASASEIKESEKTISYCRADWSVSSTTRAYNSSCTCGTASKSS